MDKPDESGPQKEVKERLEIDIDEGIPEGFTKKQDQVPLVTWTNRRRMAWLFSWATVILTLLIVSVIPAEKIEAASDVIRTFYMISAAVILGYMGTTSLPYWGMGKK